MRMVERFTEGETADTQEMSSSPVAKQLTMNFPKSSTAMSKLALFLAIVAVGVIVLFGFLIWSFDRPPVPLDKFKSVQVGMSQQQVSTVLGKPTYTRQYETGLEWRYTRTFSWSAVRIYFDNSGKCTRYEYDP